MIIRDLFDAVFTISVYTSFLIILLLCLTPLLHKFFSRKLTYFLWLLIAVRLLCPWQADVPVSEMFVPASKEPSGYQASTEAISTEPDTTWEIAPAFSEQYIRPDNYQNVWQGSPLLAHVWVGGVVVWLLLYWAGHFHRVRKLRRYYRAASEDEEALFRICVQHMKIRRRIRLYRCDLIASPMIVGLLQPTVLLPQIDFTQEEVSCVFLHELNHYKRCDLWYQCLMLFATALHWFNPLVYFMGKSAVISMEMACDEDVLHNTGTNGRVTYAQTVLKPLMQRARCRSVNFYGSKQQMKNRFHFIVEPMPQRRRFLTYLRRKSGMRRFPIQMPA